MAIIETERLILRPLIESDAYDLFEYLSNIDMHCFISMECKSIDEVKNYINEANKEDTHFAIVLKENKKVIGEVFGAYCQEFAIDGYSPCILFNKNYRRNGYGYETMKAYLEYLFNTLNIRRVYAFVEDYNKASYTMCERLGMKREGYFREFCYFLDDENGNPIYENSYQYSILKHEWNDMFHNKFKFYGHNNRDVEPIEKEFNFVKNQRHLYELLSNIWCKYSCAPRLQNEWSKDNKTFGQCSITSFLVQDIFGGEVYGILTPSGAYHCYNKIDDVIFDLTSEQFGDQKLEYKLENPQTREEHFKDENKYQRYLYIRNELLKLKDK